MLEISGKKLNDNKYYIRIFNAEIIYLPRLLSLPEPLNKVVQVENLENAH